MDPPLKLISCKYTLVCQILLQNMVSVIVLVVIVFVLSTSSIVASIYRYLCKGSINMKKQCIKFNIR